MKHLNNKFDYSTEGATCSLGVPTDLTARVSPVFCAGNGGKYFKLHITQKSKNSPKKAFRLKQRFSTPLVAMDFFMDSVYENTSDTPIDTDALRNVAKSLQIGLNGSAEEMEMLCTRFLAVVYKLTYSEFFHLQVGSLSWCLAVFRDEGMSQSQALAFIRTVQAARTFIDTTGDLDRDKLLISIGKPLSKLISPDYITDDNCETLITRDGSEWRFSNKNYDPFYSATWNIKGCKYVVLDAANWLQEVFCSQAQHLKSFNRQRPTSQNGPLTAMGIFKAMNAVKASNAENKKEDLMKDFDGDVIKVQGEESTYFKSPELRQSDRTWYMTDMQTGIIEINDPDHRAEKALIIPGERVTKGKVLHAMWYVLCIFPAEGGDAIFKFASDVNSAMRSYDELRPRPVKKEIPQPIQAYSVVTMSSVIVQNARDFLTTLTETMKYSEVKSSTDLFLKAVNHVLRTHTALTLDQDRAWLTIAMKCGVDFRSVLSHAVQLCNTIVETENNLVHKKQELFLCLAHLIALKPVV